MSKVTIIVPMYKVEKYIRKCIESCVSQTLKDIEIILINDESPDNCLNVAKEYAEKDSRIKVIDQKNSGVSVARNKGIENAKSDWIMFVDGDDWLELDAAENMYNKTLDNKCDIIVSCYYTNKGNEQKEDQFLINKNMEFVNDETIELVKNSICQTEICNPTASTNIGVPWAKLYNKKFLLDNNCHFEVGLKRMQDMVFNLYAFYLAKHVICFEKKTYHYRINESSATQKFTKDFYSTTQKILQSTRAFINKYNLENDLINFYKAKSIKLFLEMIRIQYAPDGLDMNNRAKIKELKEIINTDTYKDVWYYKVKRLLNNKENKMFILLKFKAIRTLYYAYRIRYKLKK